jgi:MscS family membrane protein
MQEFLDMTFLGIAVMRWIEAAAYILGGFVAGLLASWICKNVFGRIFAKTKIRVDDILLAAIRGPLVAIIVFLGIRMGIDSLTLEPGVAPWIGKAIVVMIACAVAFALQRLLDGLIEAYLLPYVQRSEGNLDDQLLPILRKSVNIAVWLIAVLFAIKEAGYDIGALLAGLGIGGVAIALAAKDTLPNSVFAAGAIENVSSEPNTKVSSLVQLDSSIGSEGAARAVAVLKEADYFGTLNDYNLETLRRLEEAKLPLAMPTRLLVDKR